jgi:RNA polymerase sigma factor (sigma-70 family)
MEELLNENLSDKAKYDYILVKRAVDDGDERAYAEIMDRYKEPIYYMLLRMVSDPIDAEDLTIEAFGKAFKRLDQYTPTHAFSTWLYKIASNNCIDFIRKKRMRTLSIDQQFEGEDGTYSIDPASEGLTPEEKTIKKQKIELMRRVVTFLKPRYRTLIELRYFQEYSYQEISEEVGIPLGTVKAQLFRAKELLYEILKDKKGNI